MECKWGRWRKYYNDYKECRFESEHNKFTKMDFYELVVKSKYERIIDCLNPSDLAPKLYSEGVISSSDLDESSNRMLTRAAQMRVVMEGVRRSVQTNLMAWRSFLDAVASESSNGYFHRELKDHTEKVIQRWLRVNYVKLSKMQDPKAAAAELYAVGGITPGVLETISTMARTDAAMCILSHFQRCPTILGLEVLIRYGFNEEDAPCASAPIPTPTMPVPAKSALCSPPKTLPLPILQSDVFTLTQKQMTRQVKHTALDGLVAYCRVHKSKYIMLALNLGISDVELMTRRAIVLSKYDDQDDAEESLLIWVLQQWLAMPTHPLGFLARAMDKCDIPVTSELLEYI